MDLIEINFNLINRHPWELARHSVISNLIIKHTNKQNFKIEVLDVGSGDAFLANSFTKLPKINKVHCVDTEYTSEIKNKISSIYSNQNLKLYAALDDINTNNIDLITLLDVIEHVPNDFNFLNHILNQPFIKNDALILISVPAFQSLFGQHDVLLKHYKRYNLKELKSLLAKNDLELIDGGYFFTTLLIPRLISLLLEKIRPKKTKPLKTIGNWNGGKTITFMLKNILLLDYQISRILKVLKINIPGLSCYVACRKKTPV